MASDPVADHHAISRVPDRTPAPLASLAKRTLATLRESEASVKTSRQVDLAIAAVRDDEEVESAAERSAGWQCPTHRQGIEKVSRAGRAYMACPDCDAFERAATPPADSWWATLSDDEVAVLRSDGEHVHRDWSTVDSVDVPCTDPECGDIPFMAEVHRRRVIQAADSRPEQDPFWAGLAMYWPYMDGVIELEKRYGRWLADAAMADPRLGQGTSRMAGDPTGQPDVWDVRSLMDQLLTERHLAALPLASEPSGPSIPWGRSPDPDMTDWLCPYHGRATVKVNERTGRAYRGCPDCGSLARFEETRSPELLPLQSSALSPLVDAVHAQMRKRWEQPDTSPEPRRDWRPRAKPTGAAALVAAGVHLHGPGRCDYGAVRCIYPGMLRMQFSDEAPPARRPRVLSKGAAVAAVVAVGIHVHGPESCTFEDGGDQCIQPGLSQSTFSAWDR